MSDNPWGLTPAQARAMDAVCEHQCYKAAAKALGVSVKAVEAHMTNAAELMPQPTRIGRILAWDRWRRPAGDQQNSEASK